MPTLNKIVPMIPDRLALIIAGWLDEHKASVRTKKAYDDTLTDWREGLRAAGFDLDSQDNAADPDDQTIATIQLMAQAFASGSKRPGKVVSAATKNQRLAILSSFYQYALGKKIIRENPIGQVKRAKVQAYASSRAIGHETTKSAFASIDRSTLRGKRDYALLAVALETGHRLQAIATLELQHLTIQGGKITVSFEHTKGDEKMRVTLARPVGNALLAWLLAYYGESLTLGRPGDDRAVWLSLARGGRSGKSYGLPLGIQGCADICQKYMHTSNFHRLRHEFAHTMEAAGASVSEIQAKLGHKSLATTGRYLAQLKQDENIYGDKIAALMGIE